MNFLFLEDNSDRIAKFKEIFPKEKIDFVEHASDAILLINKKIYDGIFLDHDLNGTAFNDVDPDNGMAVAKEIPKSINKNTKVIVHSHNFQRAPEMVKVIGKNSVWEPFGSFGPKVLDVLDHKNPGNKIKK